MKDEKPIQAFWWSCDKIEKKGFENFGDIITKYIIEKLTGKAVTWVDIRSRGISALFRRKPIYVVTGSILQHVNRDCVVWGAGVIRKNEKIRQADFRAVRGVHSLERLAQLGFKADLPIGDPAIILPLLYKPKNIKTHHLGIIPHYVDEDFMREKLGHLEQVKIISLKDPIEKVIDDINSCRFAISSSLHGIITCHAYGIPCLWFHFGNLLAGDNIKFADYFSSVEIPEYSAFPLSEPFEKERVIALIAKQSILSLPQVSMEDLAAKLLEACPFIDKDHAFFTAKQ